jgi:hypothetical protein
LYFNISVRSSFKESHSRESPTQHKKKLIHPPIFPNSASFGFYSEMLDILENICKHSSHIESILGFLKEAIGLPLPEPGKLVTIQISHPETQFRLVRPSRHYLLEDFVSF